MVIIDRPYFWVMPPVGFLPGKCSKLDLEAERRHLFRLMGPFPDTDEQAFL